jgi:membrane protease YdiL (CAAX protease family)
MPGPATARFRIVCLALIVEGGLAIVAAVLGEWLGQPAAGIAHWRASDLLLGTVAALPMLAGFFVAVHWPVGPLARIKDFSNAVIRPLFEPCSVLDLLLIAVVAGIGEEMLFRGFLQGILARWLGTATGLALASIVFGLFHPITLSYAVLATLLGVYLGLWYLATESLLVAITAHAVYDGVALVYLVRHD